MRPALFATLLLVGSISATAFAQPASELVPCPSDAPGPTRTLRGVFTVHVTCDRVLFEIPPNLLGRDMLAYTEFAALSGPREEIAPGTEASSRLIRWVRRGSKVNLEIVRYERWARGAPELERGVRQLSLPTVVRMFDVVSESGAGAPIIDVTGLFSTEVARGFAIELRRRFRMRNVDPDRSFVQSVLAFPTNVEIRHYQVWTPDVNDLFNPNDPNPPPASMPLLFHTSFLLLPEQPMVGRFADDRVGYFSTAFEQYDNAYHSTQWRAFINRFRLEKKFPDQPVSEPVKPIVFYISREVPYKWRYWVKRGIEDWQQVFERAGFKNAIQAEDAPSELMDPGWHPEDVRYSVVRWIPAARQNALGPSVIDPRSGEIVSSHVLLWNDVLKLAENWYFTQVGPLDPRARVLPLPDELLGEVLRYVVSHEVGHAIGLRHNFKGHSAYSVQQLRDPEWTSRWGTTASIMDYARFNYVAQPGDDASLMPTFGPYDYFAVDWGYREFPHAEVCEDEWPELDRMAARQIDEPMLRFGGEDDYAALDPGVNSNVLGADKVAAAQLGLRNVDRVVPMIVPATTRLGEGYTRTAEIYHALVAHRHRQLSAVAKLVGGVEETRYQGGRGEAPFRAVPAARQREAVQFLLGYGFRTPTALLDRDVLFRISPQGGPDAALGSTAQLLSQVVNRPVLMRLSEQEIFARANAYRPVDLLRDLNQGLFDELERERPAIDMFRREIQRNYVALLLAVYAGTASTFTASRALDEASVEAETKPNAQLESRRSVSSPLAEAARQVALNPRRASEARAAVRAASRDLVEKIDRNIDKIQDESTRLHLIDLRAELAG
jgi:hypothetical protein